MTGGPAMPSTLCFEAAFGGCAPRRSFAQGRDIDIGGEGLAP
jgi:hypothetical protein